MKNVKNLLAIYPTAAQYWVGNGFPVRNAFPSNPIWENVDPFLMLDYAGPAHFTPSSERRGVGEHPHRGFETVTLLYQGEVEHRDSAGNHGIIGPGDIQWMTAAAGIVHEEMHSHQFTRQGGVFQLVQLWVNLPRIYKMTGPRYQEIRATTIPTIALAGDSGLLRVVAGLINGITGIAQTFSPIELFDLRLKGGSKTEIIWPQNHNAALFVLSGEIEIEGDSRRAREADLAILSPSESALRISANTDSLVLGLGGSPIREPIAAQGPFVMNTQAELVQAVRDYQSGKMGRLS